MKLNPYLYFDGTCEEAFNFYKSVFGGEFAGNKIMRYSDMPTEEGHEIPESVGNRVAHVSLPVGSEILMGSDSAPELGSKFTSGNNNYICISPDSKEEADRIFNALSEGGNVEMTMNQEFYGYSGSFIDRFGTPWMIVYSDQPYEM